MDAARNALSVSLAVAILIALGAVSADRAHGFNDDRRSSISRAERECQRKAQQRAQQFPYMDFTDGIELVRQDRGVKKCIRWMTGPHSCLDRPEGIEEALYRIGVMGRVVSNYGNSDFSADSGNLLPSGSSLRGVEVKVERGQQAMQYCGRIKPPPPPERRVD